MKKMPNAQCTSYQPNPADVPRHDNHIHHVGCVSYLNAKPLIFGFEDEYDDNVYYAPPAELLDMLNRGLVEIALCPVIDYYRSDRPLEIMPVGGIASDGPTLTVRLFSRRPVESLRTVLADGESHSSVTLLRIILAELFDCYPTINSVTIDPMVFESADRPDAILLIGDKVIHYQKMALRHFPAELDLGEAWKKLTGLPFQFAIWMSRIGSSHDNIMERLDNLREKNMTRLDTIVSRHAKEHGWPPKLARDYLGRIMRYEITPPQLEAVARYAEYAYRHGIISHIRPLSIHNLTR